MSLEQTLNFDFTQFEDDLERIDSGEFTLPTVTSVKVVGSSGTVIDEMVIYIDSEGEIL